MSLKNSWRRAAAAIGSLAVIATLTVIATTSAFAFTIGTDQPSTSANGGPMNGAGFLSSLSLNVGAAETAVSSYSFTSTGLGTAAASAPSPIRVMYQQWRHDQQNDWFYLYAVNSAAGSASAPVFDYYYYTPARGATRINATTSVAGSATAVGSGQLQMNASYVYLTSGTAVPAFEIDSISAALPGCFAAVGTANACSGNTLTSSLRWGVAAQGFRDEGGSGTFTVQSAVESFPIVTPQTSAQVVYYDAWEPITGTTTSVALNDAAPAQSATGVTNASGSRNTNTASAYESVQTVTDADSDLNSGSIVWVFSSGTSAGQWFQAGFYIQRTTGGRSVSGTATEFYQSWNEAMVTAAADSQLTTNYFTSIRVSPAYTVGTDRGAGGLGTGSVAATYRYIYATGARGSLTLIGRAEDWHGRSSGNVTVGSQTVS